jgi:Family of unknown function (DUF5996)
MSLGVLPATLCTRIPRCLASWRWHWPPAEPQLQHAALRLSVRGWETFPLPAPDGSGALVVALDLRSHEALVEHNNGRVQHIPLAPDRSVGEVTRELLTAVRELVGPVQIDPTPQETPWTTPLDVLRGWLLRHDRRRDDLRAPTGANALRKRQHPVMGL